MRDIVSYNGQFFCGITDLPVIKTTQTSAGVDLANFDGAMVYILADNWTDGTMTPSIQESDDNVTFTAVASADLVLWSATSTTDGTPVNGGNAQPAAISSAAHLYNY